MPPIRIREHGRAKKGTMKRLIKTLIKLYPLQIIVSLICLIFNTFTNLASSIFASVICNSEIDENSSAEEVLSILNKKSGVYGLSKVSSDFRDLATAADDGNDKEKVALETYAYRVAKYIGAYTAAMNGVDVIAYTAGVGENTAIIRAMVGEYLTYLGTNVNPEKNKLRGEETIISADDSKVVVAVVPTDEELMIATDTEEIVSAL